MVIEKKHFCVNEEMVEVKMIIIDAFLNIRAAI